MAPLKAVTREQQQHEDDHSVKQSSSFRRRSLARCSINRGSSATETPERGILRDRPTIAVVVVHGTVRCCRYPRGFRTTGETMGDDLRRYFTHTPFSLRTQYLPPTCAFYFCLVFGWSFNTAATV